MTEPLVQIHRLTKHFRLGIRDIVHAVDDVSFDIHPKEIVGLVGESGSGKSTLGKTIIGLHAKTAGRVTFAGRRLPSRFTTTHFRRYAKRMQMIFQDPYSSLNPRMTVGEIIEEGPKLLGTKGREQIKQETREWLERVGLNADHVSRYPHEFSGGQRQRIGIARALILAPDFVICDEPISALDVSVQAQVINLLGELKDSLGLTLLFIAHDLSMVRYVSDRIAVMYLGSLIELGPADEVFFNPKHPYTQVLISSNPEPDPKFEESRTSTNIEGEIPSPVNVKPGCRFASRCPKVMDVCRKKAPELRNIATNGKERLVACYLYEEE